MSDQTSTVSDEESVSEHLEYEEEEIPFNNKDHDDEKMHQVFNEDYVRSETRCVQFCTLFFCVITVMSIVLALVGGIVMGHAESDRADGWTWGKCTVIDVMVDPVDPTGEKEACFLYTVRTPDGRELCSVPGLIASDPWWRSAPACTRYAASEPIVEYATQLAHLYNASQYDETHVPIEIHCMVPVGAGVSPDRCVTVAQNQGPWQAAWRAYRDRFVYLIRNKRDGKDAVEAATEYLFNAGVATMTVGIVLGVLSCFFLACTLVSPENMLSFWAFLTCDRYRHARRYYRLAQRHKLQ